ncbi:MAG TPA: threonine/serine dehydratase [Candidatus Elarobacter sp.]|nr:threonine/serine dehydratase [Dongiaceae bacterium]HZW53869.1 threonine/serine dehydratase [Candidatus Elarobacter sp.]
MPDRTLDVSAEPSRAAAAARGREDVGSSSTDAPAAPDAIGRADVVAAATAIAPYVRRTPVMPLDPRDFGLGDFPLSVKLELLQHTGSFKSRGAFANLLLRDVPPAGVVAASGGNHGVAVAYAAMKRGVPAAIFVPSITPPTKLDRIRSYGAELVIAGDRYADALEAAEARIAASGAMSVHAFDQRETMLGQATLAAELEGQLPEIDTLLLAVGGGGLIGGTAAWYAGRVRLVGVEPYGAPTLTRALAAGRPVDAPTDTIAADSLAPRRAGTLTLPYAQRYVERVVLVTDEAIRAAQEALWRALTIVAEPGGAAAFAALLSRAYVPRPGERVCVVICGGNSAAVDFAR